MKQSALKHQAILNAAQNEFVQLGFERANMDQICQHAGVSKRTLYRYFSSKEKLFTEVLRSLHQTKCYHPAAEFSPSQDLLGQLINLLHHEIKTLYQTYSIAMLRMILLELLRQPELAASIINEIYKENQQINTWLKQAVTANALVNDNIELMGRLLIGMFNGLLLLPELITGRQSCSEKINQEITIIAKTFVAAYGKQ